MKCRRIYFEISDNIILQRNIVWFGSYGKNVDGTAKFYNLNDKHDNYGNEQQGLSDSLTQRLNILQGELWYNINLGFPLWDKQKNTTVFDAYIGSVILQHPDVKAINDFSSELIKVESEQQLIYTATIVIQSKFGELIFSTSNLL